MSQKAQNCPSALSLAILALCSEQAIGFSREINSSVQVRPTQVLVISFSYVLCLKDKRLSNAKGTLLCHFIFSFKKMLHMEL